MDTEEDARFWADYGRFYPELEQAAPYQDLMNTVASLIEPLDGQVWLDAGCGPGTTIRLLLERGGDIKVVGVDHCPVMLGHAERDMSLHPKGSRVRLHLHDLTESLTWDSGHFDGVISNLVLPYVQNDATGNALPRLICEIHRVLKPGGTSCGQLRSRT